MLILIPLRAAASRGGWLSSPPFSGMLIFLGHNAIANAILAFLLPPAGALLHRMLRRGAVLPAARFVWRLRDTNDVQAAQWEKGEPWLILW